MESKIKLFQSKRANTLIMIAAILLAVSVPLSRLLIEFSPDLIYGILYTGLFIFLLIPLIVYTVIIIFTAVYDKKISIQGGIALAFTLLAILLIFIVPYKKVYAHIDHKIYVENRKEIVHRIEKGEIDISPDGDISFTEKEVKASGSQNIYIHKISDNTVGIMFVTNSGLLETSSGFLYISYAFGENDFPHLSDYVVLEGLDGGWMYCSTY